MDKSTLFIGIDVSKDSLDVYHPEKGFFVYENSEKGFKKLTRILSSNSWCVMEATGCYHSLLAHYLHGLGVKLSVVNPLVIKHFIKMKLKRIKTDKSDAKLIAQYGKEQAQKQWVPEKSYISESKNIHQVIQLYNKQSTSLKNLIHSLTSKEVGEGVLVKSIKTQLKSVQKQILNLEKSLEELIKQNEPELLTQITSIPGVGKKTAILLIVTTDGFSRFSSAKQITSYLGLAPMARQSGSSIKGVSRISKSGQSMVRNHLFMCSFTACNCNPACKALYDRLVNKGKSKKLALIAVCNKLIKQAYGISQSGVIFDKNYKSKLAA